MKRVVQIITGLLIANLYGLAFAQQNVVELLDAKFQRNADGTALQLNLTDASRVQYQSKILPGDGTGNAVRYFVDIYPVKFSKTFQGPVVTSDPEIKQIRWALHDKNTVRIVFDLLVANVAANFHVEPNPQGIAIATIKQIEKPAEKISTVSEPVKMEANSTPATTINTQTSLQKAQESETRGQVQVPVDHVDATDSVAAKTPKKLRIILDPGHGGEDPGAHGKRGTLEKQVTLDIALKVRRILQKNPAYEIFMTRDKDTTLQLLDRTKFANKMDGDLFVSIHANASPKRTSRGISTYFLNNADDQESLRVAMRENGELDPGILGQPSNKTDDYYLEVMKASMVKNFHTSLSTDLARAVQLDLLKTLRQSYSDVTDLGVRSARFYVLTGAMMPAILVETSFISNPDEEKRLSNTKYQESLAAAVANGIGSFFKNRPEFDPGRGVLLSEETTASKKRSASRSN